MKLTESDRRDRVEAMIALFKSGSTMAEIAEKFSITRQRVAQILRPHIDRHEGGFLLRADQKAKRLAEEKAMAFLCKFGCSKEEFERIRQTFGEGSKLDRKDPFCAFRNQLSNAKSRKVEWNLSFYDWWKIWEESGHWHERGRGNGYVMCRYGDKGAYEVGNVYIDTGVNNTRHYQQWKREAKTATPSPTA